MLVRREEILCIPKIKRVLSIVIASYQVAMTKVTSCVVMKSSATSMANALLCTVIFVK